LKNAECIKKKTKRDLRRKKKAKIEKNRDNQKVGSHNCLSTVHFLPEPRRATLSVLMK
jgi:hypothetical protein